MTAAASHRRPRSADRAFTLVEVALALGIAGFVLAGLIGAIPLASDVGRQSITQNRAASIAGTVFANLRTQKKFGAASPLDDGTAPMDLNALKTSSNPVVYYAYFDEMVTSGLGGDGPRLHFLAAPPTANAATGPTNNPVFQITLRFNNNPPGTLTPDVTTPHAQANAIEASIVAVARPREVYRFSSVIANRSE